MILIIVLHCITCIFLVGVILLQPGKSDSGIGFGSTSQSIFGSRGAGNILTHATAIAATIFLITSFTLVKNQMPSSVVKEPDVKTATPIPTEQPKAPTEGTKEEPKK